MAAGGDGNDPRRHAEGRVTAALTALLHAARDGTLDWFAVADAVGAHLVPDRCDWCVVHLRSTLIGTAPGAAAASAAQPVGLPDVGEVLEMVALRHCNGTGEAQLRAHLQQYPPVVGDAYGAGRVALTGTTRYTPHIDSVQMDTLQAPTAQVSSLQRLKLAGTIVVPLRIGSATVLGTLAMGNYHGATTLLTGADLRHAEELAALIALAFSSSLAAPAYVPDDAPTAAAGWVWHPADGMAPDNGHAARAWARSVLPEVLRAPPREHFTDDLELLISELVSNAVRHGGGLREVRLSVTDTGIRVAFSDQDTRAPFIRTDTERYYDGGRGMPLVAALAEDWGVERRVNPRGKVVWFILIGQHTSSPPPAAHAVSKPTAPGQESVDDSHPGDQNTWSISTS